MFCEYFLHSSTWQICTRSSRRGDAEGMEERVWAGAMRMSALAHGAGARPWASCAGDGVSGRAASGASATHAGLLGLLPLPGPWAASVSSSTPRDAEDRPALAANFRCAPSAATAPLASGTLYRSSSASSMTRARTASRHRELTDDSSLSICLGGPMRMWAKRAAFTFGELSSNAVSLPSSSGMKAWKLMESISVKMFRYLSKSRFDAPERSMACGWCRERSIVASRPRTTDDVFPLPFGPWMTMQPLPLPVTHAFPPSCLPRCWRIAGIACCCSLLGAS
mmetsp:Transcript_111316/g.315121  ORF Transcript_111316/g.315121 Transcript_111316/m.315121 type:complete len:280 (-) Transcript_111316:628-1467(-)